MSMLKDVLYMCWNFNGADEHWTESLKKDWEASKEGREANKRDQGAGHFDFWSRDK